MFEVKIGRPEQPLRSRWNPEKIRLPGGALRLLGAACLMTTAFPGNAALLSETFENKTGVSATTPVGIANVLNPSGLATGTVTLSTGLNASDINVRNAGDAINTSAAPSGFGSFFGASTSTNQFLVLGDQSGVIGGNPTGGVLGTPGLFAYAVPFTVQAGVSNVTVSFDWAFNGIDTSATPTDHFFAGIAGASLNLSTMTASGLATLFFDKSSPANFGQGTFSQNVSVFSPGTYYLAFALTEDTNAVTNTAVGIDNINVSAVPLPAAAWLLGSGIVGLFGSARRNKKLS